MLGRLDMSIDDCIKAYEDLSSKIFGHNRGSSAVAVGRSRYSSTKFEKTVKEFIKERTGDSESPMMQTGNHCKVSVPSFLQWSLTSSPGQQFRCCRSS
jgi:hypothetical protein